MHVHTGVLRLTVKIFPCMGPIQTYLTVKIFPRWDLYNRKNLGRLAAPQWYMPTGIFVKCKKFCHHGHAG